MKRETARLLRAVLRLIEDDVREIADSVVEIDQREAANTTAVRVKVIRLEERLAAIERIGPIASALGHPSRKVPS